MPYSLRALGKNGNCWCRVLGFSVLCRSHERHIRRVRRNKPPTLLDNISRLFTNAQAGNVFAFTPDFSQSKSSSEAIIRLLDAKPEIDSEATDGNALESVTGKIELQDIHFCYPTRPMVWVSQDFNLTVEPSTHVALVGTSGCGKSTVIQVSLLCYWTDSSDLLKF